MDQATLLWIAAVLLTLMGFAGMVLPTIPGPPLLFLGLVAAAWAEGFRYIGFWMLAVLGLMTVLAYGVDFAATAFGAKRFGASPRAAAGAALGTLVGLFFGLAGILLGPFLGRGDRRAVGAPAPEGRGPRRHRRDDRARHRRGGEDRPRLRHGGPVHHRPLPVRRQLTSRDRSIPRQVTL